MSGTAVLAVLLVCLLPCIACGQAAPLAGAHDVTAFGAKPDGTTDCTAAIQAAIDKAAEKGGQVYLPPGRWLVAGSLKVKPGVAVVGAALAPLAIKPLIGSVVMATGGRDKEDAPALFELGDSASVQGLTVFYPEQKPTDIHPYAWTFHLQGFDNTVENVTLINSYNAIRVGPEPNVRHRIRSVYGCALRRGVLVDNCTDIGRVENVQFHCHWWSAPEVGGQWEPVFEFMWKNCEAFVFGRTDWEFITNNFVFPTNIGYRFIQTAAGACNGHLTANGADACQVAVQVDAIQPMGLLITNGQFVAFNGDNPTGLLVNETCMGQVRLVNCNYWGSFRTIASLKGRSFVGFSDCYFSGWDAKKEGLPAIDAQAGRLQVQGCSFVGAPAIRIGEKVRHAIVTGNNGSNGVKVDDLGGRAVLRDNEPYPSPMPAARQYSVELGSLDDEGYVTGEWNGREPTADGPTGATTCRWSGARCGLNLPVLPDLDYDVTVWLNVPHPDPANVVGIVGGQSAKLETPGLQHVKLHVPAALVAGRGVVELAFNVKPWVPSKTPGAGADDRTLGVRVYRVDVAAR